MASGKAILVLGLAAVLALLYGVLSVINIALYASSYDLEQDVSDSADCKVPCRERTSTIGIVAGSLGLVTVVATLVLLGLGVIESTGRAVNLLAKSVLLVVVGIVGVFQLTAWALMAKDIDTFLDRAGDFCDTSPHVWNAALAFGLFAFLAAGCLFVVVAGGLLMDFLSSDSGSSGGGGGGSGGGGGGRGGSYYGDHVHQSRAEQQEAADSQQHQQQHHQQQQQQEQEYYE
jgi:uncharacterized membrane protein YgcG